MDSTGLLLLEEPGLNDGFASLDPDIVREGEVIYCWSLASGNGEKENETRKFTFTRLPMANEVLSLTGENILTFSRALTLSRESQSEEKRSWALKKENDGDHLFDLFGLGINHTFRVFLETIKNPSLQADMSDNLPSLTKMIISVLF